GDAGLAGLDGLAVALRVAGDAADGHVDAEARGGALLLRLPAPEAVLPVLTRPLAARGDDAAVQADRPGPGLAQHPGLGALTRRCEEEVGLADALGAAGPGQRPGEDQVRDGLSRHRRPPRHGSTRQYLGAGDAVSGRRWGVPAPRSVLRRSWCRIGQNLSNS